MAAKHFTKRLNVFLKNASAFFWGKGQLFPKRNNCMTIPRSVSGVEGI